MNKKESKMYGKMFAPSPKGPDPVATEEEAVAPSATQEHEPELAAASEA